MGELICCLLFTCVLIQSVTCVLRYCIGRFDISSSYDNQDVELALNEKCENIKTVMDRKGNAMEKIKSQQN
jgi:hypothetical protein